MPKSLNARVARAMRQAYEGRKEGALVSAIDDVKRLVFFERGELVGARSTLDTERLPYVLLERSLVSTEQIDQAKGFIRSGRKLGQILVGLGHLQNDELERIERHRVVDIACGILTASSSRMAFSEKVDIDRLVLTPVSIGDVFMEAVHRLHDVGGFRERTLLQDYVPSQTADAWAIVSGMKLSDQQAKVLDLVDARNSLGVIFEASPLPEADTIRIVMAFHQAGVLALKEVESIPESPPEPAAEPNAEAVPVAPDPFETELIALYNDMQCQNHWQILGLSRGAAHAEIEAAYKALKAKLEPEAGAPTGDSSFQEKLSFVCARAKDAFVTLSSQSAADVYEKLEDHDPQYQDSKQDWGRFDVSPETLDDTAVETEDITPADVTPPDVENVEVKDPQEATRLFAEARQAFQDKDYWRTIELCRRAIELDDDNDAERYHLLGRSLAENPKWRKDAELNLKIAKDLEPWEPRYLISLGELYEKEGMMQRAERTYQQVRTIDPDFAIPKLSGGDARGRRKAG